MPSRKLYPDRLCRFTGLEEKTSMSLAYSDIASQWQPARRSGVGFLAFSSALLVASLIMGVLLSSIEVPQVERPLHVEVPKRIAQYIKKRAKLLPIPIPRSKKTGNKKTCNAGNKKAT